jgi:hypothetical protein
MKAKSNHPGVFLCILASIFSFQSFAASMDTLHALSLQAYGRFAFNDQQDLELISSASHVGFIFKGKVSQVFAYIPSGSEHNYIQYELDGVYQKKIRIEGDARLPTLIVATKNGIHTVWIFKATEAHTGPIFIEKITGKNLRPLKEPTRPFIEFIGNSITCGAAADPAETPCGSGVYHDQHNAYYAYGPRVARALSTGFMLSSVSGIGIYRNWNSDGPTMPQVYEKTDFQDNGKRFWNFQTYAPDIVSIALGTNDFSSGDGKKQRLPFDSAAFVSAYTKFVQLVKSKYPQAQIALLSSPMLNGEPMITIQNCLTVVKGNIDAMNLSDKKIALYFFKPMHPRGCWGHPSLEDHALLAGELIPFFKKLL